MTTTLPGTNDEGQNSPATSTASAPVYQEQDSQRDTTAPYEEQLHVAAVLINEGVQKQARGRQAEYQGLAQTFGIWHAVKDDGTALEQVEALYEKAKQDSPHKQDFIKGVPKLVDQIVAIQFPDQPYKRRRENAVALEAASAAKITERTFVSWLESIGGKTKAHRSGKRTTPADPFYQTADKALNAGVFAKIVGTNPSSFELEDGEAHVMITRRIGPNYEYVSVIATKQSARPAKPETKKDSSSVPEREALIQGAELVKPPAEPDESVETASQQLAAAS